MLAEFVDENVNGASLIAQFFKRRENFSSTRIGFQAKFFGEHFLEGSMRAYHLEEKRRLWESFGVEELLLAQKGLLEGNQKR